MPHIEDKSLECFDSMNNMNTEEMISFLEHLDQCDFCMEQMLEEEIRNTDISAPDYLTDQILNRAAALDVQAAKAVRTTSHKMQLFYYGLRTAAGVITALFLLFTVQQVDFSSLPVFSVTERQVYSENVDQKKASGDFSRLTENIASEISRGSHKVMNYIGNFPNKLLNGGDSK